MIKNIKIYAIFILVIILVYLMGINLNIHKSEANKIVPKFISTKQETVENKRVSFRNVALTSYNGMEQILEKYEDAEMIYTTNGSVIIVSNEDALMLTSTNIKPLSVGNKNIIGNIIESSESDLVQQILKGADEVSNIGTSLNDQITFMESKNTISESQYISEIMKALNGNQQFTDRYFEKGVLTTEIKNYIQSNLSSMASTKTYVGKSEPNSKYVNRVCILGATSSESNEVKLKVILNLDTKQRVYDVDIY